MSVWIRGVIGLLVVLICIAYIIHVRRGGIGMHRAAPLVIALAVLGIALNELVVIPTWGVEAGTSVASMFFFFVILPLASYLNSKKSK